MFTGSVYSVSHDISFSISRRTSTLQARGAERWIVTEIKETTKETFRQDRRGRTNDQTRYVKDRSTRFELAYHIDTVRLAAETCADGIFPLITNDGSLSELEMLLAYKSQPSLKKRFSHLKTDFEVARVYPVLRR